MKAQREPTKTSSRPPEQRRLRSAVVRKTKEFASLKEEWDDLYNNCPSATPFSSWEWLYSWWEVYGEGHYGLRLITLRDPRSGLLVGLLPLMVRRKRLFLLGDSARTLYWYIMTPYKDVLVRKGWEQPVAEAGVRALKDMSGWRVADLQELMPRSAAWDIFRRWDGPKTSVPITDYVLIRASSWEELLSSLSKKARKTARRTLRQAEKDGVRCVPASAEDAERAARTLVGLHRELWRGRRIDPEDLTPRYEAFMQTAARRMTARGIGRISEFRRQDDGKVLVSQFLLFDKDFVGVKIIAANEEASRRYQFMTLCNWDVMSVAREATDAHVSWMHYTSPEKLRWAPQVVSSERALMSRGRAFWVPYASYYYRVLRDRYYTLRSEVGSYAYSEAAPRWVKNATERYHALVLYPYSESAPRWVEKATERYYALRREYGYYALRYKYRLAQAHREMRRSSHLTFSLSKRK